MDGFADRLHNIVLKFIDLSFYKRVLASRFVCISNTQDLNVSSRKLSIEGLKLRYNVPISDLPSHCGLKLRYNVPISDLPSHCLCGDRFNTIHALSCEKGGFVSQRLDNVRDMFTVLLDKCCTNVQSEPHLSDLQGEASNLRTANTSQGARLDIKARNFWRQGQDAFFDIRVTHVNALSYKDLSTNSIFKKHEAEKQKRNTIKE